MKRFLSILMILSSILFISCVTAPVESTKLIQESAEALGQLKASNDQLNVIILNSEERLTNALNKGKEMNDELSKLEFMFKYYDNEVKTIIKELNNEIDINRKVISDLERKLYNNEVQNENKN